MHPRRETTSVDAALIGTDTKVGGKAFVRIFSSSIEGMMGAQEALPHISDLGHQQPKACLM
jgi:hypothetical protein